MKILLLLSSLFFLATEKSCKNKKNPDNCFKGKLEISGGCMNYTISLQEGNMDTALYVAEWTDDHSGKQYKNVFALGSRCNFPANIKEGDSFYFTIDSLAPQDCSVCQMYYPVPGKRLMIKVQEQACD
ncbi:MAG: hypothetical protein ACXWB9_07205 [Flavisolibacter sp.]